MENVPYNRALGALRVLATLAAVALLLVGARPGTIGFTAGLALIVAGEALRLWAAGHLHKTVDLITSGPYRYTRNPLYLGRLSIFTGLCVMATLPRGLNWVALALGWLVFFGYYLPRKERVEPERLRRTHGPAYERYRGSVPALVPSLRGYADPGERRWRLRQMLANREHWMVAGLGAAVAWLWFRRAG